MRGTTMKNNLFTYATSELSQDAFICWLASYALEGAKTDFALQECAKEMLAMFVPELRGQAFTLSEVQRQVQHIDVLLTVHASNGCYKIIVEDKTYTREHDNQLQNYLTMIRKICPGCMVRGVYYKTGFQSDLSAAEEAGYTIITRSQILQLMRKYVPLTQNQIYLDYFEYWDNFQKETEQYRHLPVSKWGWKQINGFYDHVKTSNFLSQRNLWMGYDYVANRNGGFYGLWAGINNHQICVNGDFYELYLQMETFAGYPSFAQLCLKLSAVGSNKDKSKIRVARDRLIYSDKGTYNLGKYNFRKPARLAIGQHMTLGIYSADLSDYEAVLCALDLACKDYVSLIKELQ